MLFRTIATFTSVALMAQGAFAALTVNQVVNNIGIVTTVSGDATNAISQINPNSSPSDIQAAGQQLVTNFNTIISSLNTDIPAMQGTPPFSGCSVTQPIIGALSDFVRVHQILLATIISQHGILAQYGLTAPVAAVLRNLESVIDSFAFSMINMISVPCGGPVTTDQQTLDQAVQGAISTFEQICVPSPLYPTVPPVCLSL